MHSRLPKRHSRQFVLIPKTHSLIHLMDILEASGVEKPDTVRDADILTQYAVQSRYPSIVEEVTRAEYRDALKRSSSKSTVEVKTKATEKSVAFCYLWS